MSNELLTYEVLHAALQNGVSEFIVCAGSRNSSFIQILKNQPHLKVYYWPEERSAAFFALGRLRMINRPVAIITTSGTAVGELLPATMEAYYTGVPLLLITADRPAIFRKTGAPQSAEQVGIFSHYVTFVQDIALNEKCLLIHWDQQGPAQMNVCLDEPQKQPDIQHHILHPILHKPKEKLYDPTWCNHSLDQFLKNTQYPLAIVNALKNDAQSAVVDFLMRLQIPVVLEGLSGIRENETLQSQRIMRSEKILHSAKESGYPVDAVLRIGGVPTQRLWRDLEYLQGKVAVCSITDVPFSGLSWQGTVICAPIAAFLEQYEVPQLQFGSCKEWLQEEREIYAALLQLFEEEPLAEPSLVHQLSKIIPHGAQVYLGNSLPIREWDMAATYENKQLSVSGNRGVNGIDGQISTFLGLCDPKKSNWAIFGDLTTLYDLVAPWIIPQLEAQNIHIVVINNGGGKIFEKFYQDPEMLNLHDLNFEHLAHFWCLSYQKWEIVSDSAPPHFIELVPNTVSTQRFWEKIVNLQKDLLHN